MRRFVRVSAVVCSLILAGVVLRAALPQVPTGTWQPGGSLLEPRSGATSTLLSDGSILTAGGANSVGSTQTAEVLRADGSMSAVSSMNVARSRHTATVMDRDDSRVLVVGGVDASGAATNTAEVFDPIANTWTQVGSLQYARAGHTATQMDDGRILIVGGENNGAPVAAIEAYDPSTQTFTVVDSLKIPRKNHAAVSLDNGLVLVTGGFGANNAGNTVALSATEIFNPTQNRVSLGGSMNAARASFTATRAIDGNVVAAGGTDGANDLASIEIYNTSTGSWSYSAAALAHPRSGHLASLLPNSYAVLISGGTTAGAPQLAAEMYRLWNDDVVSAGTMTAPRVLGSGAPMSAGGPGASSGIDGLYFAAGGSGSMTTEFFRFATIRTDAADYAPGTTVYMTGTGFAPGETVNLHLHEEVNDSVIDYPNFIVTAGPDGSISYSAYAPTPADLGSYYHLTALGQSSGFQAQTTFHDAIGTSTTISSSQNPSSAGQAVTFTATVTQTSGGAAVTVGTVDFGVGGNNCGNTTKFATGVTLDANGKATAQNTFSTATGSPFTVRACYNGTGGSGTGNSNASLSQTVNPAPVLTISKSHSGSFTQGDTADNYTITVGNTASAGSTSGTVTVVDTLPTGSPAPLTATAISGTGWSCTLGTLTCTRSDVLAGGGSYPAITLTVSVASNAPSSVTNSATVSGGGSASATSNDATTITAPGVFTATIAPTTDVVNHSGVSYTVTVTHAASSPASKMQTATIAVPSGFTVTAVGTPSASAGKSWTATPTPAPPGTTSIQLTGTGNNMLNPGESVSVVLTATTPSSVATDPASLTWTTTAAGPGGSAFTISGSQPSVSISRHATSTVVSFGTNPVTYGGSANATVTVTDTDANGTKSFPTGTIPVVSDSGDTIGGICTLASTATPGVSTCTVSVTPTHASVHNISASYAGDNAHKASSDSGKPLTVNPKPVTAALTADSKPYDGNATESDAKLHCTIPAASIVDTDVVTCSATGGTFDSPNVATATKVTATVALGGANASNYTLTSTTATATPASITAVSLSASITGDPTRPYDGNDGATLTSGNFSLTGLVGTESFTVTKTTGTYNSKNVAAANTINTTLAAGDFTAGAGTLATNYTLPTTASGAGHITAITLTAAIQGDPTKPYDGNTNATLAPANFKLTGLVGTESISVTKTSGTYNSKDVATANTVSTTLAPGDFSPAAGTLNSNYNLPTSASGTGHITAVTLTAAIVGPPTKPYDGNTTATLSPANFHLTGLVGTGTFSVTKTAGTYDFKDVTTATTVTTSLLAGDFTPANGALAGNYNLPTTASGPGTISAKTLTASIVGDPTKPYNGNNTASLTATNFSLTGLVGSESFTVTKTSGTYDSAHVNAATVSATLAGTDFTPANGAIASNYGLPTTASGPGHITAIAASIAIQANDKVYDSTTTATLKASGGCTATGILAGDVATVTPSCTGAHFDTANAGPGKTVTANISLSGNTFGDYTLNGATTATTTATIQTAPVTATLHAQDKAYDGSTIEPDAKMTCSVAPLYGTDSVTCTPSGGLFNTKDVSTANQVTATVAISGNSNYTLGAAGTSTSSLGGVTSTAHIATATVGASIIGPPSKPYDGNNSATLTSANFLLTGLVGTESFTVTKTTGNYDSAHVNATTVTTSLAGTDFTPANGAITSNYTLPTTASGPGHITAKTVTASVTASSKTYNGTADASITSCSLAGVISPDTTGCAASANPADNQFADKNVGTGKLVTASNLSLTNNASGDYTLNGVTSATTHADITTAAVTPTLTALDKVYDGTTTEPNGNMSCTVAPLFAGDAAPCSASGGTFNSKDVATANQVTATVAISGGASANYTLGAAGTSISSLGGVTATAHITAAPLTVNASAADTTYTGLAYAGATTCTADGVNGEHPSATSQFLDSGNSVVTPIHAGSYSLKCSAGGTGTNYLANSKTVAFTINPATPTIHVSAASTTYTGLDYAGATSCTADGVNGEHPTATPHFVDSGNSNISTPKHVGSYGLKCSAGATGTDYVVSSSTAPFTIAQATLSINVSAASTTYTGLDYAGANTCSATGVNGETPTATPQFVDSGSSNISIPKHAGSYGLKCSAGGPTTDYVANSSTAPFTIAQATLSINVSAASTTYTGLDYAGANTCSATGVNGETPAATPQFLDASSSLVTPKHAGSYSLTCSAGGPATDYVAKSSTAPFTIAQAPLTIQVSAAGTTYTRLAYAGATTCTADGVNGEHPATTPQYQDAGYNNIPTPTNAGSYFLKCSAGGPATDYVAGSDKAGFTIAKANVNVVFSNIGPFTYNAAPQAPTYAVNGVNSEVLTGSATASYSGAQFDATPYSNSSAPTNAGNYTQTVAFAGNGNYNALSPSATQAFTIDKANQATLSVTGPNSVTYGTTGTATSSGGSGTGALTFAATGSTGCALSSTTVSVADVGGTCSLTASKAGDNNYNSATSAAFPVTLVKANAVIVVNGYSGIYDGHAHGATGSATGVETPTGANLSGLLHLGASFTYVPGGTANWTFDGNNNYNSANGSVAITINKANPVIVVTPYSVTYDGNSHTAAGTATGVLGEALSGLNLTGTKHTAAGDYPGDSWIFTDVTGNYNNAGSTAPVHDAIAVRPLTVNINTPNSPSPLGTVNFSATFSNAVVGDTYKATWYFDNAIQAPYNCGTTASAAGCGTTTVGAPNSSGVGTVSTSFNFTNTGVYLITLVITDSAGSCSYTASNSTTLGAATCTGNDVGIGNTSNGVPAYEVIYDPNAGFVTGGGWIFSGTGSYWPDGATPSSLQGQASFGFVSKYQKGANAPTGQTEFNFQVASMNFHSTSYQWLVVSGALAQYKGQGTINGKNAPNGQPYNFILTGRDGTLKNTPTPDGFRIQITDSTGTILYYDNLRGNDATMSDANVQPLTGTSGTGSVVIHSK